jgi:lysozyme family protein
MADADFDQCMNYLFSVEGGYVDNPRDPGGATNMGITQATLTVWRHASVSTADVQNLTQDEATAIYHANYWNVLRCGSLPSGIDLMVFDAGVNCGNSHSARTLQTIVGCDADGVIGPATLQAVINAVGASSALSIITQFSKAQSDYYHSLATFDTFGAGWLARVAATLKVAQRLAAPSQPALAVAA